MNFAHTNNELQMYAKFHLILVPNKNDKPVWVSPSCWRQDDWVDETQNNSLSAIRQYLINVPN